MKKRLRRKIRRIWYVILSQKNPCRLGSIGSSWRGVFSFLCGKKNPSGCPLVLQRRCLFSFALSLEVSMALTVLRLCKCLLCEASQTKPTSWILFVSQPFKAKWWPEFWQSPLFPYTLGWREVLGGARPIWVSKAGHFAWVTPFWMLGVKCKLVFLLYFTSFFLTRHGYRSSQQLFMIYSSFCRQIYFDCLCLYRNKTQPPRISSFALQDFCCNSCFLCLSSKLQ